MAIKSDAQRKAVAKYVKDNYDEIRIRIPKGNKFVIQRHAKGCNESVNGFIIRAIQETMTRDKAVTGTTDTPEE